MAVLVVVVVKVVTLVVLAHHHKEITVELVKVQQRHIEAVEEVDIHLLEQQAQQVEMVVVVLLML
jgi:hypothetical protein